MNNTDQNRKRLFFQYAGQKFLHNFEDLFYVDTPEGAYEERGFNTGDHLQLKSIRSISDKDAIEVATLTKNIFFRENLEWEVFKNSYGEPVVGKKGIIFNRIALVDEELNPSQIDRLRKLGYAWEFDGITVVEQINYRWISLK